ncbi:MAG: hypothetical protein MUP41_04685 [Desulfobacterales bacterium]|nr:hypothetical protein [Desulfobacterales bacterium]
MIIKPSSMMMIARMGSGLQATRGRVLIRVFTLFPVCFLLTACSFLSYTFRSADCDIISKAEGGLPVAGRAVVSGTVGKGQPMKGTGWFVRDQGTQGTYFIQFDPPFSAVPVCCVESQQSSFSKLSGEVMSSVSDLHLEATRRSQRCLRMEKRVEYGYVIEEKCAEWQTLQLPWDGRLKFTCGSQ